MRYRAISKFSEQTLPVDFTQANKPMVAKLADILLLLYIRDKTTSKLRLSSWNLPKQAT